MPIEQAVHPSAVELQSFAAGRLPQLAMQQVADHVEQCESCCRILESLPDDTLIQLARNAATEAFRGEPRPSASPTRVQQTVPAELVDHPRYKILGLVGLGGMGAVYKAEHRMMERLVALKVIRQSFTANPQAVERFRREVRAAARLSHANIVTAFDAEQAGDIHFLIMEFVDGVSLDRLVAAQGLPTVAQSCQLMRQAALGLQHAQSQGMVHRDIKPANLMVTRKGQLKILDFGLARLAHDLATNEGNATQHGSASSEQATMDGTILGTPDYIAPEQIVDARNADIRADIYSLGCTFYFLLTGTPPFPGGTAVEKLSRQRQEPLPSLTSSRPEISAEVAAVVSRMTAKNPQDRYQTPAEIVKALAALPKVGAAKPARPEPAASADDFLAGIDLAAMPAFPMPVPPTNTAAAKWTSWIRRNSGLAGLAVGCVVLLLAGLWVAQTVFSGKRPPPNFTPDSSTEFEPSPLSMNAANATWSVGGAAVRSKPRVLFCVPHFGVYEPDFYQAMPTLAAGAHVTVASTRRGPCQKLGGGASKICAQLAIGSDPIPVQEYDALIFAGANTEEFQGAASANLLREFVAGGKPVGALCKGQEVLAYHGYFRPNLRVANSSFLTSQYAKHGCQEVNAAAIRDGNLITGRDDKAGPAFARLVLATLSEK